MRNNKQNEIERQIKRYTDLISQCIIEQIEVPELYYNQLNYYSKKAIKYEKGLGAPYIPSSEAPRLNVEVPDKMNYETHEILDIISKEVGGVDQYVMKKLGYPSLTAMYSKVEDGRGLSAEQIDAIAMAIYNIESKNQMMIVSDQTGIGKGRIAAALIRYAIYSLHKKPIFITIRPNLFSDIYRDLSDIGFEDMVVIKELVKEQDEEGNWVVQYKTITRKDSETGEIKQTKYPIYKAVKKPKFTKNRIIPFVLNNAGSGEDPSILSPSGDLIYEVKGGEARKQEYKKVVEEKNFSDYDLFLMTYSQFKDKSIKKIDFLNTLVKDNIIILDESHEAGGDSNTGTIIKNALNLYSPIGGLFLSATFAKDPKNMPIYAATTSMKYAGLTTDQFVVAMQHGGNALQEIISAQLAQSGCFIRRERPLSNIKFNYITLDSEGKRNFDVPDKEIEHCAIFDNITRILKKIIEFQRDHINPLLKEKNADEAEKRKASGNKDSLSYKSDPIFNGLFQIVNQAIFSLKAEPLAERAIQRMRDGVKPVITFQNTMDTWLEKLTNIYGKNNEVITDFSVVMANGLQNSLEYTQIEEIVIPGTDENGKPTEERETIKTSMTINPEVDLTSTGKNVYYDLVDTIREIRLGIGVAPIDIIKTKIINAGFKVGEITGRKREVVFTDKEMTKGYIKPRKKEETNEVVMNFQNNLIDCILLNESGSTGISLQSKPSYPDVTIIRPVAPTSLEPRNEVKKRCMIIGQPNLDINKMVQTWGRVNRSGQAFRPEYDFVTLAVPAEIRLMLFLQRKLRSLDANTTSNQKQNESVINLEDFLNEYGDECVENWLSENEDLDLEMGEPLWKKVSWSTDTKGYQIRYDSDGKPEYYYDQKDAAKVVTGRVALLTTSEQKRFYTEVNDNYVSKVQQKKNDGTYNLEVEFLPLNAKILNDKEYIIGNDDSNPFASSTIIEELEVDILTKPFSKLELENIIFERLGLEGLTPDEYREINIQKIEDFFTSRSIAIEKAVKQKWEKQINEIPEKSKIKKLKQENDKEAYRAEIQKLTNEYQQNSIDEVLLRKNDLNVQKIGMQWYFKTFRIGEGYIVSTGEETIGANGMLKNVTTPSVFVGFVIDEKKTNPWAPSNVTLRFATSSGTKYIDFQPTPKGGKEWLELTNNLTNAYWKDKNFLDNWQSLTESSKSDRETRYMLTGNLLQAYRGNIIGKLVSFTYEDGTIKKGILLPKTHKETDMTPVVPIIYCKKLIEDMYSYEKFTTNTKNGNSEIYDGITFRKESYNDRYKIIVGNSAKTGAIFYKNQHIIDLMDNNGSGFRAEKGTMVGYISMDRLDKLLEVLNTKIIPPVSAKLTKYEYEKIKNSIPQKKETKKEENTSIIIKFEAKYINSNNMKAVAGIKSQPKRKKDDDISKELSDLEKFIKKIDTTKAFGFTRGKKIKPKNHNIDLDNINI